ncbi:MAG: PDZ domain-containing protein, partial [Phycisphaerae bacterium]|nr:PDZ domain-containing protein [Phycisphaerae bacterium]
VIMVAPDGPADKGGIKDGDFILSVDSQTVANSQEFRHIVADISPGTTIPIELYRDGETMVMSVKIILQPENMSGAFRP